MRASNAGGVGKIAILDQYLASLRAVNAATAKCYTHSCAGPLQVGDTDRWRPLLFAGDGRRSLYDKKVQRYAEDNGTEFNCTQW